MRQPRRKVSRGEAKMTTVVIYILSIYVKRSGGGRGRIDRNSVWSPAARHRTKSTMKDARSHFL